MPATEPTVPTLDAFPRRAASRRRARCPRALAAFPVYGRPPRVEYVAFADGCARGLTVKELDRHASVNDLVVLNPTDVAVLLYEGEEFLGARQNRTFDVSVLVPPSACLRVPVSCVEHGRWDGARHHEAFSPAPQAAYPSLRRLKNCAAHAHVAAGLEARAEHGAVWDDVAAKGDRARARGPRDDAARGDRDPPPLCRRRMARSRTSATESNAAHRRARHRKPAPAPIAPRRLGSPGGHAVAWRAARTLICRRRTRDPRDDNGGPAPS